jgi:hypothetical protein
MLLHHASVLEIIAAHDTEHAAIWRQRYESAIGAVAAEVDLKTLDTDQLSARKDEIRACIDAVRKRERQLEAELLAVEMEAERRPSGAHT